MGETLFESKGCNVNLGLGHAFFRDRGCVKTPQGRNPICHSVARERSRARLSKRGKGLLQGGLLIFYTFAYM